MIVTNAFSSTLNRQAAINGFGEIKDASPIRPLIDFLAGNSLVKKTALMTWNQALLYQLLIRSDPNQNLQQVIQTFAKEVYDKNFNQEDSTPILWLLIRFYGLNVEEPSNLNSKLWTYNKVQMYPKGDKHF